MDDIHNFNHAPNSHKFPIVISFYTKDTEYEVEVQNLRASCKEFGLEACIEGVESYGNWEVNCAFKPFFIHQKIQQLKRPVLWVDADGVFVRKPILLDFFQADFAVRIDEKSPVSHPSKVISSTIYVNYTPSAEAIMRRWAFECKKQLTDKDRTQEFWDQIALRDVLFSEKIDDQIKKWDVRPLPLSYAKIFDHPGDLADLEPSIIQHYQASRRFKSSINNKT